MQVDPIKPALRVPGTKRLKLKYYKLLSSFAFKSNLRRYSKALQDGRLLDLGLSPAFYRIVVGRTLGLADLAEIDPALGHTLGQLSTAARRIEELKAGRCRLTLSNPRSSRLELSA